jgi:hypothetical protein
MSKPRKLIQFIKEEVIGTENTLYAWMVLAAVFGIVAMGFFVSSPSISFHGIAGSRDSNVNFDFPVEIQRVHVNPGQKVHKGELLVEMVVEAKGKQYVFAETDGIVGSVNVTKGESVPAFSPLLTVSPENPTFVQGYVHEALNSNLKVGTMVHVSSMSGHGSSVIGRVAGLGGRFVQIPERLSNYGRLSWGREVQVEIIPQNSLLVGEKVIIKPVSPWMSAFTASASSSAQPAPAFKPAVTNNVPQPVKISPKISDKVNIELSGAIYLEDMKKFLVASDDPGEKSPPWLFMLSDEGEIEETPVTVAGVKKLKDIESVSAEGQYTYVMSSLWAKGRERKKYGNEFIRFKREGLKTSGAEVLEFAPVLKKLMKASQDPVIVELLRHEDRPIEVEAHAVVAGDLYVGLKAPLLDNDDSVILRIRDVNNLFEKKGQQSMIEVWKKLRFSEENHRISDISFVNGTVYLTTTRKKQAGGAFWSFGKSDSAPRPIRSFPDLRPEALAYDPVKNVFLIGFDGGKEETSNYLFIAGPRSTESN